MKQICATNYKLKLEYMHSSQNLGLGKSDFENVAVTQNHLYKKIHCKTSGELVIVLAETSPLVYSLISL